jgi:hypothetical protein
MLLEATGCGNFQTDELYKPCPESTPVTVEAPDTVALRLFEPTVLPLRSEPAASVHWRVAEGELPDGLTLSPASGIVTGFPLEAGTFPLTVEVTADPLVHECFAPGRVLLTLVVGAGCESAADCPAPAGTNLTTHCDNEGVCSYEVDGESCPESFGQGASWDQSALSILSTEGPWTVAAHAELTLHEKLALKSESFTHRLALAREEKTAALYYRLPEDLPLPLRVGEEASFAQTRVNGSLASAMAIRRPNGGLLAVVYRGAFLPDLLLDVCDGQAPCPVTAVQLSMPCDGQEDQCGEARPALLLVTTSSGDTAHLAGGQRAFLDAEGIPLLVSVASAYNYLHSLFDFERCAGLAPTWSSFAVYPGGACPVARILRSGWGVGELDKASSLAMLEVQTEPVSPEGTPIGDWRWELTGQPYPGFVRLVENKGPLYRSAELRAAGLYTVSLEVEGVGGAPGCLADIEEVEVKASSGSDLRIELVWQTMDSAWVKGAQADLLLMHPAYARFLDAQGWSGDVWTYEEGQEKDQGGLDWRVWICAASNPKPMSWPQPGPEPPDEAPPEERTAWEKAKNELCDPFDGAMTEEQPEIVVVRRFNRDNPGNRYPVAVFARPANSEPVMVTLRVFVQGVQKYEQAAKVLLSGQTWYAGDVDVDLKKFKPR